MSETKILAFVNQKGGVAKTTSAAELSAALAQQGKRVLAVDLDPQADLTMTLGAQSGDAQLSIAHVLANSAAPEDAVIAAPCQPGLDIIPGSDLLGGVEQTSKADVSTVHAVREILREELPQRWDWIIMDTPPAFGVLQQSGLIAAHYVIVPASPGVLDFAASMSVLDPIAKLRKYAQADMKLLGVLLTRVDPRLKLTREIREQLAEYEMPLIPVEIPSSIRVAESPGLGAPIVVSNPGHAAARAYGDLARWLIDYEAVDASVAVAA